MRRPIAKIRINAGNPGWYDPLTNIHLTITRPEALVFEGANTTNIERGIAYKLVSVVDGDLNVKTTSTEANTNEVAKTVREVVSQPIQEEVKDEIIPVQEVPEVVEETVTEPVEEKVEETVEEVVAETEEPKVEEKPKKKSSRKTKAKKETTEE